MKNLILVIIVMMLGVISCDSYTICDENHILVENYCVTENKCDEGFVYENNKCINSKLIKCDSNSYNYPDNSEPVIEYNRIFYYNGKWEINGVCDYKCNRNFINENGYCVKTNDCTKLQCETNAMCINSDNDSAKCECHQNFHFENGQCQYFLKQAKCEVGNIPNGMRPIERLVKIEWNEDSGWTKPIECKYELICDYGFHGENGICVPSRQEVDCKMLDINNGTYINNIAYILWDKFNQEWTDIPICDEFECNTGFYKTNFTCLPECDKLIDVHYNGNDNYSDTCACPDDTKIKWSDITHSYSCNLIEEL